MTSHNIEQNATTNGASDLNVNSDDDFFLRPSTNGGNLQFIQTESGSVLYYPPPRVSLRPNIPDRQDGPYVNENYDESIRPGPLSAALRSAMKPSIRKIKYGQVYIDMTGTMFRHITLPPGIVGRLPADYWEQLRPGGVIRVLLEQEWRTLGIKQSRRWEHIEGYAPNPEVLIFRKYPADYDKSKE